MSAATPPIFTLTGNLLAERTLEFPAWAAGRTQRATGESFHARGKGVNVSNMLARLGTSSIALIFAGGAAGAECEAWLRHRGLAFKAFSTRAATRTGTIIWSGQQPETTFLGPDVVPDAEAVAACASFLNRQPAGGVLALCGSFPGWDASAFDPLRQAVRDWTGRGKVCADVYGPPLHWISRQPVELIKINRQEFDAFADTAEPRADPARQLQTAQARFPVKNWIVSNGPGSIWLAASHAAPREFTPPRITEVSPTGSGDVLFACLLHALLARNATLADALAFSLPFAAANAAHPGVADFPLPGPA
jgi:fructose-1-phosphate kinase PfkB-like protein